MNSAVNNNKLLDNTVILELTFHQPGMRRTFRPGEAEVRRVGATDDEQKADQSRVRSNRKIIENEYHDAYNRLRIETKSWLRDCIAVDFRLGPGRYAIPVTSVEEVFERLDEVESQAMAHADAAAVLYENRLSADAERESLRELYDPSVYDTPERYRSKFWIERRLIEFTPPGESKVGAVVAQANLERIRKDLENEAHEVKAALRFAFGKLLGVLTGALTPDADGKRKKLHPGNYERLERFLSTFDKRNVLDDDELKQLVVKAREVMDGFDYDALKKNKDDLRAVAGAALAEVEAKATELVAAMPSRRITFGDDE